MVSLLFRGWTCSIFQEQPRTGSFSYRPRALPSCSSGDTCRGPGRNPPLDSPASGQGTSAAFPVGGGNKKLARDEPIMIDIASVFNGFHMDETRMFAIGSMPREALDASLATIEIHNTVLDRVRPGIPIKDLFDTALTKAEKLGYAEPYLGPPGYKVQFIGHGIGLELIEQPILSEKNDAPLRSGMTFALEPKMVFKDRFSAGVESVFTVTETGHRLISQIPLKVFVC